MTALIVVPPDSTPETVFRCVHYSCTLAFRHCLRRQAERFQKKGETAGKRWKVDRAQYPFCAEQCEDGRAITAHFGRAEPSVLSLNGFGLPTKHAPRLPTIPAAPQKEEVMPAKPRTQPADAATNAVMTKRKCRCVPWCGRYLRKNNTSGYSGYCNGPRYAAGERAPRKTSRVLSPPASRGDPRALGVDALLARRDELLAELAEVQAQIREQIPEEEARLARLRAAASADAQREASAA